MTTLCVLLAMGPALVWGVLLWNLASAHGRLGSLGDVDIERPRQTGWPRLSVVVPARNEATDIEEALRSLLAQDYPDLEVIAVDDRSEDGTGAILDRLATEHASLRVLHIAELPDGWLGKTHACHAGARLATGSFLLFTDADVRFAPDALRRAIAFATSKRLGHLVAWPQLIAPGFWERCFQATFAMFLNFKLRPWELHVPGSRGFVGMGAFNLVSRDSYAKVGGHEILAMEVVDDVKLGLVLRRSGIRQGSIAAGDLVRVPWARGLSGSLRGLLKNAFAGLEWRWAAAIAGPPMVVALTLGPWLTVLACDITWLRIVGAAAGTAPMLLLSATAMLYLNGNGFEGLALPLTTLLLGGVVISSAILAGARRGIYWRGTFYPLTKLREGCVREADWPAADAIGW